VAQAAPGWGKRASQRPCATLRRAGDGGGGGDLMTMSVVIPTYQRLRILTKCLRALEAQHLEAAYEVLVVDDGSTDGTVDFLTRHAASFPHVRLLVQVRMRAHSLTHDCRPISCRLLAPL
jgi:cellulose synthase/poly-beta-1,6-N-acetylglucosamine synthase-like glycosyltransferase